MGRLTFEGDNKTLETIAKSNRLRAKKYGVKVSLELDKKQPKEIEVVEPKEVKPKKAKTSKSKK